MKKSCWFFRIGVSTLYKLVPEVCTVLCQVLKKKYISLPTQNDWKCIADGFYREWNFPNCISAIDGKHLRIRAPMNSGSKFFNYKKFFSISLMAMCDAYQRFTWVNIGDFGEYLRTIH